jgi:CRISPR-associated endoribonuclease Cas6
MFFLAIVLKFRMQQSLANPVHTLRLLDATCWCSNTIERDGLSAELPLTVALLPSPPLRLHLRLVWRCDGSALARLTSWWTGLREGLSFQIGSYQGQLESVHLDGSPGAAVSTWADITSQRPCTRLRLLFLTPMIPALSEQAAFPFPEPLPVFSRVYERWNELDGPPLPLTVEQVVAATRCVVSGYRVNMVVGQERSPALRGYTGWVEFECRTRQVEALTLLNGLARFAFYTGLGYYTERGMGATRVVQKG